ncbi:MAG: hypothetical protein IH949_07975, partial [Bacteroidetes bacterium]|nr:hypothetical protein [Bacteroidota bacterium]
SWDPYNAVILCEYDGKIKFEYIEESITFREEIDEQKGDRKKKGKKESLLLYLKKKWKVLSSVKKKINLE